MTKYFFVFFLLTVLLACSKKEETLVRYYKDIEISTLEGKEEINQSQLEYPCIKIGESLNRKVITFFFNKEDTVVYDFSRSGNSWFSYYEYEEPLGVYTYYEFVTKRKIIQIKYHGRPDKDDYRLVRLDVTSDLQRLEYVFSTKDSLKIPPSEIVDSFPLDKAHIRSVTTYQYLKGVWKMHTTVDLKSSREKIVNDSCADFGLDSFAWYLHCYFFVSTYECR